ncbi:MAG: hypothetical protein GX096_00045 [Clostridiales bacterium]|nr:hypothetical protein [Clostridiales bacterium]
MHQNERLLQVLDAKTNNYMLPFFWQHGKDEQTLRAYMNAIQSAGCGAVCVEARPHPDFCGPLWWRDMDIILDEAEKRNMKVWILDDDHFPTGHANGALLNAPETLCRQSVYCKPYHFDEEGLLALDAQEIAQLPETPKTPLQMGIESIAPPKHRQFDDDELLGIFAYHAVDCGETIDLLPFMQEGALTWQRPSDEWRVYQIGLSRNYGPHRDYINMMDRDSCKVLIDAVYEPHYARYKAHFGQTIAGFFSDEPELGNGALYDVNSVLGTPQDLPWSRELQAVLTKRLGVDWKRQLVYLWTDWGETAQKAKIRCIYMDSITQLVECNFSMQLGEWCRDRGVEYIGHIVEDNNQHARLGSSLGHYFRALAGQDMAGVDLISQQIMPMCEDDPQINYQHMPRDGEFFHYMLAKLASSYAAIDPLKKGRALCEIFGNYRWSMGVQLGKYLIDHCLVRGINHFTPHAFSPKAYPDGDCPPHFYAGGHNPQYRHFAKLFEYANRVCHLINGGHHIASVAVLYHAEAEWSGGEYMLSQKVARCLTDHQIDFDYIPADVFERREHYKTDLHEGLRINGQYYQAFVLPMSEYIPSCVAKGIAELQQCGFPVFVIDQLPKGICDGDDVLLNTFSECNVIPLHQLVSSLQKLCAMDIAVKPANNRIRCLHYQNPADLYLFINEGNETYEGEIFLQRKGPCVLYNAWENRLEPLQWRETENGIVLSVTIVPLHSLIVVFDVEDCEPICHGKPQTIGSTIISQWQRSVCSSIDYPHFSVAKQVKTPDDFAMEAPDFSGFVRYEAQLMINQKADYELCITDAAEGVELFVNGSSAGMQIAPPFRFDISSFLHQGANHLAIEVATTLERERAANPIDEIDRMMTQQPTSGSGITGDVFLLEKGTA